MDTVNWATSICCSLNRERTTPGSIAPERVPTLEVGQMAADLDALAGAAAVPERMAGTADIHCTDRSLLSDQ